MAASDPSTSDAAVAAASSTVDTTDAPQLVEHVNTAANCTPYDVKWVPSSARFVVAGLKPRGTGCLQVYELGVGKVDLLNEVRSVSTVKPDRRQPHSGLIDSYRLKRSTDSSA